MGVESQYHLIDMLFQYGLGLTKMWKRFCNAEHFDDELDLTDKRDAINTKLDALHTKMTETPNPSEWQRDFVNGVFADITCLQQDIFRYQECTVAHQKAALTNKMTLGLIKRS